MWLLLFKTILNLIKDKACRGSHNRALTPAKTWDTLQSQAKNSKLQHSNTPNKCVCLILLLFYTRCTPLPLPFPCLMSTVKLIPSSLPISSQCWWQWVCFRLQMKLEIHIVWGEGEPMPTSVISSEKVSQV